MIKMYKLLLVVIAAYLQCEFALGQRQWISPTTTAQEMRNPATWYRPYRQAAYEAWAQYYQNAQEIRRQLWQQAYITGAFGYGPNNPNVPNIPNNPNYNPNNNPSNFPNPPNNPNNPNNPNFIPNNPDNPNNNPSNLPNVPNNPNNPNNF